MVSGRPGPWKSVKNDVWSIKNEGTTLSQKKHNFLQKEPKSESQSDPRQHKNNKKPPPRPYEKEAAKQHLQNLEKKPVLAREREAR